MPRITIFISKDVADKKEAMEVVEKIKQLTDVEIKKENVTIQANYQEEL